MAAYNDKDIHLQGSDYESPVLSGKNNKDVSNGSQEGIDLDHRRRAALDEVDNASFNRYHVKAVAVACIGFLTDAYDIFAISMAATMIGYVYHHGGANTANQDLGIKVSHSIGTFCGQLLFGWLADVLGRKKMYGIELIIIIIGTVGTAIAGQGPTVSIYGVLIFWRFIMGLGIGGDYPLSAIITSEFASTKIRGRMMTAVFAGQGWGNLLAAIVAIITVTGFKHQIIGDDTDYKHVDYAWRILLGFGCVPAAGALYFRLTIPETPRFTMDIERNVQQAAQDVETYLSSGQFSKDPDAGVQRADMPKATRADFFRHYGQWKNGKILFGCAWSWFALDVAFYGLGLNSSIVLTTIGFGSPNKSLTGGAKVYQNLHNIAVGNIILSAAGLVPGYWTTFLFIDWVGRKPIQLMGFTLLTIIFFVMGGAYHKLLATTAGKHGFTALYCLANYFQNFGPNTTTFIIPGEAGSPTRFRSTFHGISAASGKLGAIIAQVGFSRLKDRGGTGQGVPTILLIFGAFMATGIGSTLLLPETKGRSLEELSDEDQDGFVKGPVPTNFATHI